MDAHTYLSKCTTAYYSEQLKIIHTHFVALQAHVLSFLSLQVLQEVSLLFFCNICLFQLALQCTPSKINQTDVYEVYQVLNLTCSGECSLQQLCTPELACS